MIYPVDERLVHLGEIHNLETELAKEQARKIWCLENRARIDKYVDDLDADEGLFYGKPDFLTGIQKDIPIIDGDINGAIDKAMNSGKVEVGDE